MRRGIKGLGELVMDRKFESISLQRRVRVSRDFALPGREAGLGRLTFRNPPLAFRVIVSSPIALARGQDLGCLFLAVQLFSVTALPLGCGQCSFLKIVGRPIRTLS